MTETIVPPEEPINPSPDDVVYFPNPTIDAYLGKLMEVAGRLANQGYSSLEDWSSLQRLVFATSWVNEVQWADGR